MASEKVREWIELRQGTGRIFFNEFQVYGFHYDDEISGLGTAAYFLVRLRSFPVPLRGRETFEQEILQRKVRFMCQEHTIDGFNSETGTVTLRQMPDIYASVDLLSPEIQWKQV